jgi:hypothetical protein
MISGIGYDPDTKTCQVAFKPKKNGLVSIETLPNMSAEEFNRFQNAASYGIYFRDNLRSWPGKAKTHDVAPEDVI